MNRLKDYFKITLRYIRVFALWLILGAFVGAVGGGIGALFSKTLIYAADVRAEYSHTLFLLPAAGIIIVAIYKLCSCEGVGTNTVFQNVRDEKKIPALLAPAVFIGTALTHLCGGSAGREGAALQIGGSVASFVGRVIRIDAKQRHILTMCGMSALFSALFGTPVGACIFAVEVASIGRLYTAALFPSMVSSTVAYGVATALGVHPERYAVGAIPELSPVIMLRVGGIAVAAALVSILFCTVMHKTHHAFERFIKNAYIRVACGGIIIIGLTFLVGSGDYNGSGANIIEGIFRGEAIRPEAFLLKMLFTAITIGSGFKGGEIVPTLFIGATLGGTVASLIGLSTTFGAALGIAALFVGVTNCPLTSIILAVELFGSEGIIFYMMAVLISYLLSGKFSLYTEQHFVFSKLDDTSEKEAEIE